MKDNPIFKMLDEISKNLKEMHKMLSQGHFDKSQKLVINNDEFIELFGISSGTAANWRKQNKIAFKKINNKIYYNMKDVVKMLEIEANDLKST